jgi:uncharacterized protein YutE (UPF0331/DUF86 family)
MKLALSTCLSPSSACRSSTIRYYNTFVVVGEMGILPNDLAIRLANTTGLRNRLVHQYEKLIHDVVYYSLKPLVKNYRRYIALIGEYLRQIPTGGEK